MRGVTETRSYEAFEKFSLSFHITITLVGVVDGVGTASFQAMCGFRNCLQQHFHLDNQPTSLSFVVVPSRESNISRIVDTRPV